uniref:Uncharacterized protein n=1 Tax=Photinus pyralis TaxID=7054 RepID=A0A1Y1MMQ3_PHOPY
MLSDRLDKDTATRFELECGSDSEDISNKNKTFKILTDFLNKECAALDTVSYSNNCKRQSSCHEWQKNTAENNDRKPSSYNYNNFKSRPTASFAATAINPTTSNKKFQFCTQDYDIYNCPSFLAKTPEYLFSLITEKKWCSNCRITIQ